MPQIDQLLESMTKFGAQAAVLTSGERVQLAFPTGNRYASQTISHPGLMALVEEILPEGTAIKPAGATRFLYESAGAPVLVQIEAGANSWRVWVKPQAVRPATPAAAAPAAAPPPSAEPEPYYGEERTDDTIERMLAQMLEMGASDLHLSAG